MAKPSRRITPRLTLPPAPKYPTFAERTAEMRQRFSATEEKPNGQNFTGSKFLLGQDIVDIAKLIRAEIKTAVAAGDLPPLTAKVNVRRYRGGQSLDVVISNLDIGAKIQADKPQVKGRWSHAHGKPIKKKAAETLEKIDLLIAAYNYDHGDVQSDYFNQNFIAFLSLDEAELRKPAPAKAPKPEKEVKFKTRFDYIG